MSETYVGIDPGWSGAIASFRLYAGQFDRFDILTLKGASEQDVLTFLEGLNGIDPTFVMMEKVNAGPKMGSSAAFKFGKSNGMLSCAVVASGLRLEMVSPQRWQRKLGLIVSGRGLGMSDTDKKNRNKALAQQLFPQCKITHQVADALLIAEYCRRVESRVED